MWYIIVPNMVISRQHVFCIKCAIVTSFEQYLPSKNTIIVFKIRLMSSWTYCGMSPWLPPLRTHRRTITRADSRFAPSQWATALLYNDVSHWLGASLEAALITLFPSTWTIARTTPMIVAKSGQHSLTGNKSRRWLSCAKCFLYEIIFIIRCASVSWWCISCYYKQDA